MRSAESRQNRGGAPGGRGRVLAQTCHERVLLARAAHGREIGVARRGVAVEAVAEARGLGVLLLSVAQDRIC
jgi:hypothetical protein